MSNSQNILTTEVKTSRIHEHNRSVMTWGMSQVFLGSPGPWIDHGLRELRDYSEGNNCREYSPTDRRGTRLDVWQNKWTTCLAFSDWTSIRHEKLDFENMSSPKDPQILNFNRSLNLSNNTDWSINVTMSVDLLITNIKAGYWLEEDKLHSTQTVIMAKFGHGLVKLF